jgi:uncharacterized membrane protein
MTLIQTVLPLVAGAGSAVVGGFYVAFSAVVMPALHRRPASEAVAAMVSINEQAVKPPFMALFFGTAAACGAVAVTAATDPQAQAPLRVAGAAAYLAGWILTMAANVPHNNRLLGRGAGQPGPEWDRFQQSWVPANHLRAALSVAGAAGLLAPISQP